MFFKRDKRKPLYCGVSLGYTLVHGSSGTVLDPHLLGPQDKKKHQVKSVIVWACKEPSPVSADKQRNASHSKCNAHQRPQGGEQTPQPKKKRKNTLQHVTVSSFITFLWLHDHIPPITTFSISHVMFMFMPRTRAHTKTLCRIRAPCLTCLMWLRLHQIQIEETSCRAPWPETCG